MPTELSLRVESFRVEYSGHRVIIPVGDGVQLDRFVEDVALFAHHHECALSQAISKDLQLCEFLAPVVALALAKRDISDVGPIADKAWETCQTLRNAFPGGWVHAEAGRILAKLGDGLQKDAATVADRARAAHDQHAQHDGQSEVTP